MFLAFIQCITCQGGVPWHNDGEIPDKYECEVSSGNVIVAPYSQVNSNEDPRIHAALRWVYNWYVHRVPGNSIIALEETVYFVEKHILNISPVWSAQLEVFSVWEQERQVISFRLSTEHDAA